jgi:hypothetical protein
MKPKACLATAFVLCCAAVAVQGPVTIAWKPKAGQSAKYHIEIVPETPFEMKFTMDITSKVVKVEGDKISVESAISNSKLFMNGQEQPGNMDSPPSVAVFDPLHEVWAHEIPEGPFARMNDANNYVFPSGPVSPGESWKRKRVATKELGNQDSEASFTYDGEETVGRWKCHKVKFAFKETKGARPIINTGTLWLSIDDGQLVQSETSLLDFEYQEGMYGNSKSKTVRIE